ncbi:hypothetical protein DFH27DRAFT_362346 [Peziza echinospora]|nr:hypothetical protein DFH27DRAFT_362346 [Peziza echinospora]
MASSTPSDGRKSPTHKTQPRLAANFFGSSKSKKAEKTEKADGKAPIDPQPSPRLPKILTKGDGRRPSAGGLAEEDPPLSPSLGYSPSAVIVHGGGSQRQKSKLTPSTTFNTHYRSISRSMNDLGNIFSRGRSPPNRETSPRRPTLNTLPEGKRSGGGMKDSPRLRSIDTGNVPLISVVQHGDGGHKDSIIKEGWVNIVDSHSVRKGPLREAWKLQHAVVSGHTLMLFKPPSHLGIKSFDISAPSEAAPPRPQTAPATASQAFNTLSIRHKSAARHPDLVLDEKGNVKGGTLEALCHEIVFTEDKLFVKGAVVTLPAWASPETGINTLLEVATIKDSSVRINQIVSILLDSAPGLLLEIGYYNSLRLLVEKGVTPHDPQLAKALREKVETKASQLKKALESVSDFGDVSPGDYGGVLSSNISGDEFLQIAPEIFATQLHLFHLKYLQAWNPANDLSLLLMSQNMPTLTQRNPLVFTSSSLHFLTDRVFHHILSGEAATNLHYRVNILSQWLEVAELLKRLGDMVGWLSVIMAVSSPSILRLRETWSLIDPLLVDLYSKGGRVLMMTLNRRKLNYEHSASEAHVFAPEGIGREVAQQDVVPFFGDLCHCMDEAYASRSSVIDYPKFLFGMKGVLRSLEKWKSWFATKAQDSYFEDDEEHKEIEIIQRCFRDLNQHNTNPPSTNMQSYFDMSLICEPSSTGMYLQSHYHQRLPLSIGANLPLVLTDVLPRFSLFDKEDTLAIAGGNHQRKPSPGNLAPQHPGPSQSNQNLQPPSASSTPLRRVRSFPPSNKNTASNNTTGYDVLDFTTRERTAGLSSGDEAMLRAIRDVAGVSQQLFQSKDGELVLKSITEEQNPSRPSSVIEITSSSRVSVASRRISVQMNNSTGPSPRISVYGENSAPTPPSRSDLVNLELSKRTLAVVPKGGTLERLVDILILGVHDFSKRMISSEYSDPEYQPWLTMDMNVFTVTFFATFRSYCSPVVLLDYLKKRLIGSKSAATITQNANDDIVFPDWTGVDTVSSDRIDWSLVAKIHIGILEAIHLWVSEFFVDFYCDHTLSEYFVSFVAIANKELAMWKEKKKESEELKKTAEDIEHLWADLKKLFSKQMYTPFVHAVQPLTTPVELSIPPAKAIGELEVLVEQIEKAVSRSFKAVKLVDWILAFEILETQSAEPLGFFVSKLTLLSNEEDLAFQDIYFLLDNLRRVNSNETILESLPTPLQDLCVLHRRIGDWVLGQITDSSIKLDVRAKRIAALLRCLAICRTRMSGMDLYESSSSGPRQHIPSFVESAISAALVRPESRMFSVAWSLAADETTGSGLQVETLEQIVPKHIEGLSNLTSMTPCAGWLIERMLEIVCYVPNMLVENNRLINFDKRRYVYNLINNFTSASAASNSSPTNQPQEGESEISFGPNYEIDRRALREVSARENQGNKHSKLKIFWRLFYQEQEKLRRDAKQREVIERQQRDQVRAMHRRQPTLAPEPGKRGGKRLGVNTLFKAVRPISMALTNSWTPPSSSGRTLSPHDLPSAKGVVHNRKPNTVIDLSNLTAVTAHKGTREKFMWRIRTESGTSYLLQATTEAELDDWLRVVANIRGIAATDGAESIDGLTMLSNIRVPLPVFGVSLEELCRRDGVKVPLVVEALLGEIESRGLDEVGIYRVPGSLSSINALKAALDSGEEVRMDDDRWYDINAIAGCFKLFMRELPGPTISSEKLGHLKTLTVELPEEADRINAYRNVMMSLPIYSYHFLRRIYLHFQRIAANSGVNKMGAVNLAIVFGMGLAPELSSGFGVSPDLGIYQTMVKLWISHATSIFPEVEDDEETEHDFGSINRAESTDTPRSEHSAVNSHPNDSPQSGVELASHGGGSNNEPMFDMPDF